MPVTTRPEIFSQHYQSHVSSILPPFLTAVASLRSWAPLSTSPFSLTRSSYHGTTSNTQRFRKFYPFQSILQSDRNEMAHEVPSAKEMVAESGNAANSFVIRVTDFETLYGGVTKQLKIIDQGELTVSEVVIQRQTTFLDKFEVDDAGDFVLDG